MAESIHYPSKLRMNEENRMEIRIMKTQTRRREGKEALHSTGQMENTNTERNEWKSMDADSNASKAT